jgi:hypothetical protein
MSLCKSIFHEYPSLLWGLLSTRLLGREVGIVVGGSVLNFSGDSLCYNPSTVGIAAALLARWETSAWGIDIQT